MVMKLGWVAKFDDRSRKYQARNLFPPDVKPVSKQWIVPLHLNQGNISACVGFSWCHYLASLPEEVTGLKAIHAIDVYKAAQHLDEYPGESYEGTSVLAGIKAVQAKWAGVLDSYHWCFNFEDLIITIGHMGPVVLGVDWFSSFFQPDVNGFIHFGGALVGGHAIVATEVNVEQEWIRFHNSWGTTYGFGGDCFITFADMKKLVKRRAEMCVPVGKHGFVIA